MSDDDLVRRRRLSASGPRRSSGDGNGWLITIAAAIVVVVAGWFLGIALARFANSPKQSANVAQATPTASPQATPAASPAASATASPKPTPHPKNATTLKPRPTPSVTPQPSPTPTVIPTVLPTRTPQRRHTMPVARRTEPTPAPARAPVRVAIPANAAETTVRGYIEALRRGDPATASAYLGNGSPDESFIDSHTSIVSMHSVREADGSYVVAVTMSTPRGQYVESFDVATTADGNRILQKSVQKI